MKEDQEKGVSLSSPGISLFGPKRWNSNKHPHEPSLMNRENVITEEVSPNVNTSPSTSCHPNPSLQSVRNPSLTYHKRFGFDIEIMSWLLVEILWKCRQLWVPRSR
jgi:hypothetical protein